jgi:DNA-binding CsgD family transcriptional regulator
MPEWQTRATVLTERAEAPILLTAEMPAGLSEREAEVLLWVAQGKTNGEIGLILGAAEKTIKKHMGHIFEKLGVENRASATGRAIEALRQQG